MDQDRLILEPGGLAALGRRFDDAWSELEARSSFTTQKVRDAARADLARFLISLHRADGSAAEGTRLVDAYLRSQFRRKRQPAMWAC